MNTRLLNNLPIEDLTKKKDYLDIIEKGKFIDELLTNAHLISELNFQLV